MVNNSIILIDDDSDFLETLKSRLAKLGFNKVRTENDPIRAAAIFTKGSVFDIAMIDMTMPEMDGMELLETIKTVSPRTECIMVTAVNEARVAVECLNKGAYDYLVKPISQEDLVFSMRRTLERKRLLDILDIEKGESLPRLVNEKPFQPIITRSKKVLRVLKEAELHAASDVPILITGESGTGKELLAQAIHAASPRASSPFTPVNMANISGSLFEAEFFGHTKGAFTGAENSRIGYLEYTDRGTLFLDEIGNLPLTIQGKLLRVLQDGEYLKLGTSNYLTADVRFIAATNEALDKLMAKKMFRKDLYYRIRGGWLQLPPLRDRQEDIPLLVDHFLKKYQGPDGNNGIEEEALCLLMEYSYPGNVRELKSIVQSAVNLAQNRPISSHALPDHLRRQKAVSRCQNESVEPVLPLAQVEKAHILRVYRHTNQNKSRAARLLGIGLNTLRRKLKSYGIT
jgi:DNA-binding NtrC family response regulator